MIELTFIDTAGEVVVARGSRIETNTGRVYIHIPQGDKPQGILKFNSPAPTDEATMPLTIKDEKGRKTPVADIAAEELDAAMERPTYPPNPYTAEVDLRALQQTKKALAESSLA